MPRPWSVGHVLRRTREVGVGGIGRRLYAQLTAARRAGARARWRERFAGGDGRRELAEALTSSAPRVAREALLQAPFFFDARADGLREAFRVRHAKSAEALLAQADAALAGDLSFVVPGGVPDWHAVLPGGGRWPVCEPDATGYGAARPPGDVRLTWEIGRGPHLVRMAQAGWLTGDARYVRGVVEGIRSWIAANPVGFGIGWAHAQEAALRAIAWLWCFRLTGHHEAFDDETFELLLRSLLAHGAYVESHLADHVLTHNHLVSELGGLLVLGTTLPMLRPARGWQALGQRLLEREIAKQVDAEGMQGEQSIHYHAFVLDTCLASLWLGRRAGAPLSPAASARIERMAEVVALLLLPDGRLPPVGDTDAGRAFRLDVEPLDRRDVLAAAAIAFGRGDLAAISGDAAGAFFLTGGAALPAPEPPGPALLARRLAGAGLGVARTGFGREDEQVLFRAGATRLLPDVQIAHAHADALSVGWRVGPHPVLLDPGVFLYSEGDGWREALRRTRAHTTVELDGADQADVTTARFGVQGLRTSRWLSFEGGPAGLRAEAEHPARGPIRVRRRLVWSPPGILALHDEVLGAGQHDVTLCFQLPASQGEVKGDRVDLVLESGLHLRIDVFADAPRIDLLRPAAADPPGPGWWCSRYGERRPGTALRVTLARCDLPAFAVTLLRVTAASHAPAPTSLEASGGGRVLAVGDVRYRFPAQGGIAVEAAS